MSPIEHYFENLLTMGSDIKGEQNKNALSKEVQEAVEICADYIKHNQFQGQYLTENCIACKYDEIEESDGEHCKKCLAGDSQFELDKEFVDQTTKNDLAHNLCDSCTNIGCELQSGIVRTECAFYMPPHIESDSCGNYVVQGSTTKNDIRDNGVKNELNRVKNELESTTKNNLGVDCISREQAIQTIQRYGVGCFDADEFSPEQCERFVIGKLKELPSIEPKACNDCISREEVMEILKQHWLSGTVAHRIIAEIGNSVQHLPSVQIKPRKGHWIEEKK